MAFTAGNWKAYLIGFLVGVLSTVVFFYSGAWDYFARSGDRVERRVRNGVEDLGESVEEAGVKVKDKTDNWIDTNFKK